MNKTCWFDDEWIVPLLHKNDHMSYIKYKDAKGGGGGGGGGFF
jgi:hypothetical protein